MTDELLKMLVGTGVGGIIGVIALLQLQATRREHRADLAALREELHDALATLPEWLQAIHSRLGGLGADSVPPPSAPEPRRRKVLPAPKLPRLQTAPSGYPVPRPAPEPAEDEDPFPR